MKNTSKRTDSKEPITMTMDEFIASIGAGRYTANRIAEEAEAKIYIGRRILINVDKVRRYIDKISE